MEVEFYDSKRTTYVEKLTLQEIGDCYGLTPERVRKIKEKALRRLKHGIRFSPFQTDILTTLRPLR